MKEQVIVVQLPKRKGLARWLKSTALARRLKKIALVQRIYEFYQTIDFLRNYKKFDHGDEFKGYICKLPFEYAEITNSGELSACCYLPKNFGNAYTGSFRKAWNSYFARKVRESMLDGSFSFCDKTRCRSMQYFDANLVKKNEVSDARLKRIVEGSKATLDADLKTLSLGMDYTCNLECPSCRTGMRKMGKDEEESQLDKFRAIMQEVGPTLELIHIAGDGDPFASKVYRSILFKTDWTKYPKLKIGIQTNGVPLNEKMWNSLPEIARARVTYIGISIDGATAPTYEKLRLGGKFEKLVNNIEFLAKMPDKNKYGISLNLNMIVQADNYQEMIPLVEFGKKVGVDKFGFTYMYNWGTFTSADYGERAVHLPAHPGHSRLLEILADPLFDDPSIDVGNLTYLKPH